MPAFVNKMAICRGGFGRGDAARRVTTGSHVHVEHNEPVWWSHRLILSLFHSSDLFLTELLRRWSKIIVFVPKQGYPASIRTNLQNSCVTLCRTTAGLAPNDSLINRWGLCWRRLTALSDPLFGVPAPYWEQNNHGAYPLNWRTVSWTLYVTTTMHLSTSFSVVTSVSQPNFAVCKRQSHNSQSPSAELFRYCILNPRPTRQTDRQTDGAVQPSVTVNLNDTRDIRL